MKLVDILKQSVRFKHYRNGSLFYETEDGRFTFEVPTVELGDSAVMANEKASLFMKWIKRGLDQIKED